MATPEFIQTRLPRILTRLIERTEADETQWDVGAPSDSYAVDVGDVRFRVRSLNGNGRPPVVLEFLRNVTLAPILSEQQIFPGAEELLERLYSAARTNAFAHAPDPFESVEMQLGLQADAGSE